MRPSGVERSGGDSTDSLAPRSGQRSDPHGPLERQHPAGHMYVVARLAQLPSALRR